MNFPDHLLIITVPPIREQLNKTQWDLNIDLVSMLNTIHMDIVEHVCLVVRGGGARTDILSGA